MKNLKWPNRFYEMAELVGSWSKDGRKVGAVVFRGKRHLGSGYNGYPKKVTDVPDCRSVRLAKTVHAELNAILACKQDLLGAAIVVTHHPCASCAAIIIQAEIEEVYCKVPEGEMVRWAESFALAKEMFEDAGIKFVILT